MGKNRDKKVAGEFDKKAKQPSAYKLEQMGRNSGPSNPADSIGLNPHPKHKR